MKQKLIYAVRIPFIVCVILAAALLLRLYHLDKFDLWFDELGTNFYSFQNIEILKEYHEAKTSSLMIEKMKNDPHSFLYYIVVYFYSMFFGNGLALRGMSVIFSMLSLGVFYGLSRLFFERRASIYALCVMALSSFQIWYAQEARAYAMASFLSLAFIYVITQALKTDKWCWWALFPLAGFISVLTNYLSVLLLLASGFALIFKEYRQRAGKWLSASCVTFFLVFLFAFIMREQYSFVARDFWLIPPDRLTLLYTWGVFLVGYTGTLIQYQISLVLYFMLFLYGVYSCFRVNKADAVTIFLYLFFSYVVIYCVSKFFVPIYLNRQLFIFAPFYYLFIAKGIEGIQNKRLRFIALCCAFGLMVPPLFNYYRGKLFLHPSVPRANILVGTVPKKNYRSLLEYINREFKQGDVFAVADVQAYNIFLEQRNEYHGVPDSISEEKILFLFYPQQLPVFSQRYIGMNGRLMDNIPESEGQEVHSLDISGYDRSKIEKLDFDKKPFKRLWLLTASWEIDSSAIALHAGEVKRYMMKNYETVLLKDEDGVYLDLYSFPEKEKNE